MAAVTRRLGERFGLDELVSEDFQHDRLHGTVQAVNPFATSTDA